MKRRFVGRIPAVRYAYGAVLVDAIRVANHQVNLMQSVQRLVMLCVLDESIQGLDALNIIEISLEWNAFYVKQFLNKLFLGVFDFKGSLCWIKLFESKMKAKNVSLNLLDICLVKTYRFGLVLFDKFDRFLVGDAVYRSNNHLAHIIYLQVMYTE